MATYYVDPISGVDSNLGSDSSPIKSFSYASAIASTGDTIIAVGNAPQHPYREEKPKTTIISPASGVTISSVDLAYIAKTVDISNGALHPSPFVNNTFDAWSDMSTPIGWTSDSSVGTKTRIAGELGGYAIQFNASVGAVGVKNLIYLESGQEYTINFRHKSENTSNDVKFILSHESTARYLQSNGTWSTTGSEYQIDVITGQTEVWRTATVTFTADSSTTTPYNLIIEGDGGSGTISYDNLTIIPTVQQYYTWELVSGSTYRFKFSDGHSTPSCMMKCLDTEWDMLGVNSLASVFEDTSAPISPAPGKFGLSGLYIYYTLSGSETIDSLHIEAYTTETASYPVDIVNKSDVFVNNLDITGGYSNIHTGGTSSGIEVENCKARGALNYGMYSNGSSSISYKNVYVSGSIKGDGFTSLDSSAITVDKCFSHDNYDDGVNSNTSGKTVVTNSVFINNNRKDSSSCGVELQGTGGADVFNNIFIGNAQGLSDTTSGAVNAYNNIAIDNSNFGFYTDGGTLNQGNNIAFSNTNNKNTGWPSVIVSDPKLFSGSDYHLQPTSPCIGAGTKITGITKDIEGNPLFPPYNIGPYGLSEGALGVAPVANEGAPRNNITRLTGTSTTIDPVGTYKLADTQAARDATGFVYGVDHWAFTSIGVPKEILGSVLIANGGGNQFFCGSKRIAGYSSDQVDPALAKIKRMIGV